MLLVVVTGGARQAEAKLIELVRAHRSRAAADLGSLGQPLRIVVPSRVLRSHLMARLTEHCGAVVGVTVQTLHSCALEILEARGAPSPRSGDALFGLLVSWETARVTELEKLFGEFRDGHSIVASAVADLLDAGFEPSLGEVLQDWFDEPTIPQFQRTRGAGLLRVADAVYHRLAGLGLQRGADVLRTAAAQLGDEPEILASSGVLIYGFADGTGAVIDLLEAVARNADGYFFVDRPPDRTRRDTHTVGADFGRSLRERLAAGEAEKLPDSEELAMPVLVGLRAPGGHAEVRAVAERIGQLLDQGVAPECIGVVARDLAPYVAPVRLHMDRLKIPFSGAASVEMGTAGARLAGSLFAFLSRGDAIPIERWLDLVALPVPGLGRAVTLRSDLRLMFRVLGTGRLRDALALDLKPHLQSDRGFGLPFRSGSQDGEPSHHLLRRFVPSDDALFVLGRGLATSQWRVRQPERFGVGVGAQALQQLMVAFGWGQDGLAPPAGSEVVNRYVEELASDEDIDVELTLEEFASFIDAGLQPRTRVPLGGGGAGVQVLSVTEARAVTFEHLFVLGLNRDVFPRMVSEDPILPDTWRRRLREVLPDVPIKSSGFEEERALFAQLLSAAPNVTLAWQSADDDGKLRAPSPLVDALDLEHPFSKENADALYSEPTPLLVAPPRKQGRARVAKTGEVPQLDLFASAPAVSPQVASPVPRIEHAVRWAVGGIREAVAAGMAPLLDDDTSTSAAAAVAAARAAILAEMDPDLSTSQGHETRRRLGPYLGTVGPAASSADLRAAPLFVTTLEGVMTCPWQSMLRRVLRVESPRDPMESLPTLDQRILGNTVHRVLERIAVSSGAVRGGELAGVVSADGVPLQWPDPASLEVELAAVASEVLREHGVALPGLVKVLQNQAALLVARAAELDAAQPAAVLAAESRGAIDLTLAGGQERIGFQADRVDSSGAGLHLSDYKTGSPLLKTKTEKSRRKDLLKLVASGRGLQGAAYAFGGGADAEGRYVFLRPDVDEALAVVVIDSADEELRAAFESTSAKIIRAWTDGVFFPRLTDPDGQKEPSACDYCDVAEACYRGDSGVRGRLVQWMTRDADVAQASDAGRDLWHARSGRLPSSDAEGGA